MKRISPIFIFIVLIIFSCKNETKENTIKLDSPTITIEQQNRSRASVEVEKDEIIAIINAFKNKDEKALNERIDTNVGFYIIPGSGTLLHFEKLDKISFTIPLFKYHRFGNIEKNNYKIIDVDKGPEYSCEDEKWDKYGLFLIGGKSTIFSNILDGQILGGQENEPNSREIAKSIDAITKTVFLTEKNSDIIFGIAKIHGKTILTYLDLSRTYCDI